MSNQTEQNNLRDLLRYEDDSAGRMSREMVTVVSGQNLSMGAVVGKLTKALANSPADEGVVESSNAGTGTVTSVSMGAKAKIGTYRIECLAASPMTLGVFDPDGNRLEDASAGAYTSDHINFTFTDGSPADTAEGDAWIIVVGAGSGEVKEISLSAVDGTQDAYGFVTADADASGGAIEAVAIVKWAKIVTDYLVWPDVSPAWTDDQKAAALAQLAARDIVACDEA